MRRFKQLRPQDRDRIYQLYQAGKTQSAIAKALGRNKGTTSRELKLNWHQIFNSICLRTKTTLAQGRSCFINLEKQTLSPGLGALSEPEARAKVLRILGRRKG